MTWSDWKTAGLLGASMMALAGQTACQPTTQTAPATTVIEPAVPRPEPAPQPPVETREVVVEPPDEATGQVTELAIGPKGERCRLVWEAGVFIEEPTHFAIGGIRRVATTKSPGCEAGVLYDAETDTEDEDLELEALDSIVLNKPGQPLDPEIGGGWSTFDDVSFDGWADLCIVVMMGAYNYSQRCWLFDRKSRTYRRYPALDPLIFMEIDADQERLRHGHRVGGPTYWAAEHAWIDGDLAAMKTELTTLGERPDGSPLPAGFDAYVIRQERVGGRLVTTFEGPTKSP